MEPVPACQPQSGTDTLGAAHPRATAGTPSRTSRTTKRPPRIALELLHRPPACDKITEGYGSAEFLGFGCDTSSDGRSAGSLLWKGGGHGHK